jgi:excisionase family DNA binding protein
MDTESEFKAQNGHSGLEVPGKQSKKKAQWIQNPVRPRLLPLKKAAECLGVSDWTLRTFIWNGVIPYVRYPGGRKMFIDVADLDRFVERNKITYN